jgi:iron complex transport system substrate-binding protein
MRVVSLFPAATEIVAALGGGAPGWLVGVSHECDYPPAVRALPRVTRTTLDPSLPSREIDRILAAANRHGTAAVEVDIALLRRLAPDVLIGQSVCEVCAVGPDALAAAVRALDPKPRVITLHAHDLPGVYADIRRVGEALDLAGEAEELVAGMRYRLSRLQERRTPSTTKAARRTLVLEWLDPPYVAGHWVPELVAAAGGVDVGAAPGERSRARPWKELAALAPDLVVIAPCGFDVARARREYETVTDPDASALLGGRVEFLDGGAYTSRPGPRLAEAAAILAGMMRG